MNSNKNDIEKWKQEILETEQEFAEMVKEKGIHDAFIRYAAEDAVLMRNNDLVIGKENIAQLYKNQNAKGLSWTPDFIDVATSGDLAYTYGHFTFSFADSSGNSQESKGVFHTIWKRQADGSWKFVWD